VKEIGKPGLEDIVKKIVVAVPCASSSGTKAY
jgi:hypothetical protein